MPPNVQLCEAKLGGFDESFSRTGYTGEVLLPVVRLSIQRMIFNALLEAGKHMVSNRVGWARLITN
jgi:hypothetical protein